MNQRIVAIILASVLGSASAFSPAGLAMRTRARVNIIDPLGVGYALELPENDPCFSILEHARKCISSNDCSLEETEECLDEVLHMQSDCATGAVESPVCENVDVAAELVANLRAKISSLKQAM